MAPIIKIGDIFQIPIAGNRIAYGQYVFRDPKMGPLIQVLNRITDGRIEVTDLKHAQPLFPPVITGLYGAIHTGLWTIIGYLPVKGFTYPNFISTTFDLRTGHIGTWYIWDGHHSIRIGTHLPEKNKQLEFLVVWAPQDIAIRIETGQLPEPYRTLVNENRLIAP